MSLVNCQKLVCVCSIYLYKIPLATLYCMCLEYLLALVQVWWLINRFFFRGYVSVMSQCSLEAKQQELKGVG